MIDILPYDGKLVKAGATVGEFKIKSDVLFDEVRAGGRINLIIGRSLTGKAREFLGPGRLHHLPPAAAAKGQRKGLHPGAEDGRPRPAACRKARASARAPYCEPKMTTVGSQDTTGPMTRDELKDLACLGFSADLVMQSFCHTAAYPKPVDVKTHRELPAFISNRGGVALRPGDG